MTEGYVVVRNKDIPLLLEEKLKIPQDYKVSGIDVYGGGEKRGDAIVFLEGPDLPENLNQVELSTHKTPNGIFVQRYSDSERGK